MVCKQFQELSFQEKHLLLAKLNHLVQSYDFAFDMAKFMVDGADKEKMFEGVKFLFVADEQVSDDEALKRLEKTIKKNT